MNNKKTYIPIEEVAAQTGIKYKKLLDLRYNGEIESIKEANGRVLINTDSVIAWKDKNLTYCKKPKFLGNPALVFGDLELDFETCFKPILSQNKADEIFNPGRNELRMQYWVTNTGRVYDAYTGVYLKPDIKNKYYYVNLKRSEKEYNHYYIHYLVAYYFCRGHIRFGVRKVHHIDQNPLNNNYKNLIWVTDDEHGELHRLLNSGDKKAYRRRIREIQRENNKW